jgi:hypothetical protein
MSCRRALFLAAAFALAAPTSAGAQALSYDYFKAKIEPIFLKKRPGHTRCIVCHAGANNAMRLTPLGPGATAFTEEQSKTNFETVSQIVVPGKPMESHFLLHPLDPHAGGGMYHSGGRQFESTDDPDWKNMAAWVNGAK